MDVASIRNTIDKKSFCECLGEANKKIYEIAATSLAVAVLSSIAAVVSVIAFSGVFAWCAGGAFVLIAGWFAIDSYDQLVVHKNVNALIMKAQALSNNQFVQIHSMPAAKPFYTLSIRIGNMTTSTDDLLQGIFCFAFHKSGEMIRIYEALKKCSIVIGVPPKSAQNSIATSRVSAESSPEHEEPRVSPQSVLLDPGACQKSSGTSGNSSFAVVTHGDSEESPKDPPEPEIVLVS
ncbi:MAG: hypothetical protein AAGI90_04895 [Chlamydiota bacterium]